MNNKLALIKTKCFWNIVFKFMRAIPKSNLSAYMADFMGFPENTKTLFNLGGNYN